MERMILSKVLFALAVICFVIACFAGAHAHLTHAVEIGLAFTAGGLLVA